ncbi:MAG: GpE family phage tail protein [Paracoccus sp. (in: a-proteobacteria)]
MADLAVTFHWTPRDMDPLSLSDLIQWRERARVRTQPEK